MTRCTPYSRSTLAMTRCPAINTRTCDGTVTSGCARRPPSQQAGPIQNPGYNPFPGAIALLPKLATAYTLNVGGGPVASVVSIARCNATDTAGCRHKAPAVASPEFLLTADPATHTIYAGNLNLPQIDVIDSATCRPANLSGCAAVAEIPMKDPQANVGSISDSTHTLYASDPLSDTVAVINTAACNATDTAGCGDAPPVMTVGPNPEPPVLNPASRTLYVADGASANQVAVLNAGTCNAVDTVEAVRPQRRSLSARARSAWLISAATNTIYAPATGLQFDGHTMAVINGATCNGTDHFGCGHLAATVTPGSHPPASPWTTARAPSTLRSTLMATYQARSKSLMPRPATAPAPADVERASPSCRPARHPWR